MWNHQCGNRKETSSLSFPWYSTHMSSNVRRGGGSCLCLYCTNVDLHFQISGVLAHAYLWVEAVILQTCYCFCAGPQLWAVLSGANMGSSHAPMQGKAKYYKVHIPFSQFGWEKPQCITRGRCHACSPLVVALFLWGKMDLNFPCKRVDHFKFQNYWISLRLLLKLWNQALAAPVFAS